MTNVPQALICHVWGAMGVDVGLEAWQVLLMCIIVFLAVMTPILARRRKSEAPKLHAIQETAEERVKLRRTADQALTDLLETSREISAQIDTKIRVLNKLVKDADRLAARLERSLGEASARPAAESRPARPPSSSFADGGPPEKADEGVAGKVVGERPRRTSSGRWMNQLHRRIHRLQKEAKSPAEIARLTDLSVEEVRLVQHMLSEATRSEEGETP